MFRRALEANLREIFGFKKTTYNAPSDSFEQDTLFVEISDCKTRLSEGKVFARVAGELIVFSQMEKFTYGALLKRIEKAAPELKKDIFFFNVDRNIESSPARLMNIEERRTSFIFLFSAQHDPNLGSITSLELEYSDNG